MSSLVRCRIDGSLVQSVTRYQKRKLLHKIFLQYFFLIGSIATITAAILSRALHEHKEPRVLSILRNFSSKECCLGYFLAGRCSCCFYAVVALAAVANLPTESFATLPAATAAWLARVS